MKFLAVNARMNVGNFARKGTYGYRPVRAIDLVDLPG
ncbi:hypothetical protein RSC2_00373 [Bacillus paralicheniformis]|nr:hypothetical protein RSC1_02940 [Bacillus paralicheniformis]BCE08577.1 hypothetical protein RSC2_00373 [Bacillus paralicheniformis]BCE14672.1 hypothetical protein RSC3_02028 [Bacillus paralicheniformis]